MMPRRFVKSHGRFGGADVSTLRLIQVFSLYSVTISFFRVAYTLLGLH